MKTATAIPTEFRIEHGSEYADPITVTAMVSIEEPMIHIRDNYGNLVEMSPWQAKALADVLLTLIKCYPEKY